MAARNLLSDILVSHDLSLKQLSAASGVEENTLRLIIRAKDHVEAGVYHEIVEGLNKLLTALHQQKLSLNEIFPGLKFNVPNNLQKIMIEESVRDSDLAQKSIEIKRRFSTKTVSRLKAGDPGIKETTKRSVLEALNEFLAERPVRRQYTYNSVFPETPAKM
jgi:DNA-binding Xre family transcriptional regulator